MHAYEMHRALLMGLVADAPNQRIRPGELGQKLAREIGSSIFVANEIVRDSIADGDLVYAYRDPCSFVEIPCNGCDGSYRAARPMTVVEDASGQPWLCDVDAEPGDRTAGSSCWSCGDLAFTRS